ncbi:hypothetical protein ACMFMG_000243 [Clarireedia jacksonii]
MESATDRQHNNGSMTGKVEVVGSNKHRIISPNLHPVDHANDSPSTSPTTSPPYWHQPHQRSVSNMSIESVAHTGITLQDNTDGDDSKNEACWAKSVYIEDHVVVNGSKTNIGAFVVWNITVETLHGGTMRIRKRYSEFDDLRLNLIRTFPNSSVTIPPLPPKSVISKFRPRFLENRRSGLQYFLK